MASMSMSMSSSQQNAMESYVKGDNIFISGQAGTGKSFIINEMYNCAIENKKKIQITALTGCAALLLGKNAKTVHSWAGVGIGTGDISTHIKNIKKYNKLDNWSVDILIIDEVSMLSESLFELLDAIGKKIRKSNKPFGGIQLVFCGDFYQLPPIEELFCFESTLWEETFDTKIVFTQNYRKTDVEFQTMLNEVREGKISPEGCKLLIECTKKKIDEIKPTVIYPTKRLADQVNQFENITLTTECNIYKACKSSINHQINAELDKQKGMYEDNLTLKIGSQVMCIVNLDQTNGIVNGSQGVVVGFDKYPIVQFNKIKMKIVPHLWKNEKFVNEGIYQIPLILSWAITIHKAQGITLDQVMINIGSSVFEYGQIYVALSRVRSIEGLYIISLDVSKIKANPKVIKYYNSLTNTK